MLRAKTKRASRRNSL